MRRVLLATVLLPVLALTGCGPVEAGAVAVTVKGGRVYVVAVTCGTSLVRTAISTADEQGYREVAVDTTQVSDDSVAQLPTRVLVDDLEPGLDYQVEPEDDEFDAIMFGSSFRKGQLLDLAEDEVVVAAPPDPRTGSPDGAEPMLVRRIDDFVAHACS